MIFDPGGGDTFDRSRKCIAFEGRLLATGFAGGTIPSAPVNHVLIMYYSIVGVHWGLYRERDPDFVCSLHAHLIDFYQRGKIRPVIGMRVGFRDAVESLEVATSP